MRQNFTSVPKEKIFRRTIAKSILRVTVTSVTVTAVSNFVNYIKLLVVLRNRFARNDVF